MDVQRLSIPNATVDPRMRRYVTPSRVVWQTSGTAAPKNADGLLEPDGPACVLQHDGEAPGFVLDFGRELHGGVQIARSMDDNHAPVKIRVRFGESVSETMGQPNNDHAIHDTVCEVPWYGHAEIGNTGFRFVRIDLVDAGRRLELTHVRAVFVCRDLEYKGAFRCSDERLNQIWETGAYTVHLCMQDLLWDGAKRDRLVWIGDMHPETMVIASVFGDVDIVPRSLDYVRDNTPLPHWMNGISSYSLWWVLIQHDWYLYHGNREYLEGQRGYLLDLLALLRTQVREDNGECLGPHRFLDWPSSGDDTAIHAGLHALLTMGLDTGAELCRILGETEAQYACLATAARLRQYLPPPTSSKVANALLVLAHLANAADTNRRILAADPFRGVSTFYGYYLLQARAAAGDYAGCLDLMRTYWGGMLDLGATTFWEDFNLDWTPNAAGITGVVPDGMKDIHGDFGNYCYKGLRHSLCHGWAGNPTAWLSEHVLGCRPIEPGCTAIRVRPNLAGLSFAEGRFPTPYGNVIVSHKAVGDKVESQIDAPPEVRIVT